MKGKRKQIKHFKMEHRIQSARERTGLNSRQIKRQAKREGKGRNKIENNIRSSKPNWENLVPRIWIKIAFGVFCAIVSSYFGLLAFSDPIRYTLYNFSAIFFFSTALDLFLYLKK